MFLKILLVFSFFYFELIVKADEPPSWVALSNALESIDKAPLAVFGLRDDGGRSMDCLEVIQLNETIFGLYHARRDGVFSVHLARSEDLRTWTHVTRLDDHASQASAVALGQAGILVAYEKDAPNSCWLRLRSYPDLDAWVAGDHEKEFDVPRTLAPTAEGTPSIERVDWDSGSAIPNRIDLRFHYFRQVRVDRAAYGSLTMWKDWSSKPLSRVNGAFEDLGIRGNLGDRTRFRWGNTLYYLQEAQNFRGDWRSWGIYLCDESGIPLKRLNIRTPKGSMAFANASASWIVDSARGRRLVVTLFLPGEGAQPGESGSALYAIDLPDPVE